MTVKRITLITFIAVSILVLALMLPHCTCETPDPARASGVALGHQPAPSLLELALRRDQYVGSPSITLLPDGAYIASHDVFGRGSSQDTSGITKIYRSTDRGNHWTQTAVLDGQFWSTVFAHNGALFVFGYAHRSGNIVIRKSLDGGFTWTTPDNDTTGLLRTGTFGGTSNCPVIHEGRLWIAQSTRLMSAPVNADLLRADSWTLSKGVSQDTHWLDGNFTFWSEGQVAASPKEGVVVLPKINQLPYTAILRAESPAGLSFNPELDFAALPGAEKKFGAVYDPVSERFYICSNPVLPTHKDDWRYGSRPAMIRNAAALLSSADLHHWRVEQFFLYSPDMHHEAFQYFNFVIDGDDLAVVSRTAFKIGGHKPPRGHDSNLMTFHRILNFREAAPLHELKIDGSQVVRHEQTQHERMPLGVFAPESPYDGKPLDRPAALAQDDAGDVYIREKGGRTLKFDAAGNFLEAVTHGPAAPFSESLFNVRQPARGSCSWTGVVSRAWDEPANWYYWGRPDTPGETLLFGSAGDVQEPVTIERIYQVKGLRFQTLSGVSVAGHGSLIINAGDSEGVIDVVRGGHALQLPLLLFSTTRLRIASGAGLVVEASLDLGGQTLILDGPESPAIDGPFKMGGGTVAATAGCPVRLGTPSRATLDGTLEVLVSEGRPAIPGDRYQVLEFPQPLTNRFRTVKLPDLPAGLEWDTAMLYAQGTITVRQAAG